MPSQSNRIKSNKIKYSQLKPRNMECIQTLGCFCLLFCFDVITQESVWFNFGELTHWFRRTEIPAKPGGHPFCGDSPIFFLSLHIAQCPACLNLLAYCWYEIISDGINSCSIFNIQIGTKMVVVLESEQVVKIARAQFCTFLQFPLSTFEHDVTN